MKKLTQKAKQKVKQKVHDDPELFVDSPLLIIALNFMTIGGYMLFEESFEKGFTLMVFAAVLIVLYKYLENKRK